MWLRAPNVLTYDNMFSHQLQFNFSALTATSRNTI